MTLPEPRDTIIIQLLARIKTMTPAEIERTFGVRQQIKDMERKPS